MKKIIALLLALMMVFTLAACGGTPVEEPTENQTEAPTEGENQSAGVSTTLPSPIWLAAK